MADLIGEKISQQQSGGSPQNADEIIIARSGLNFKLTLLAIKNWIVSVFTNKSTLDKLGDNGGNLTYNGEIVGGSQQVLDNFSEYENATNYTAGDTVKYNLKLYECILDCQGILPTNETFWTEVSASESTFGSIWEEGYYNENQVVLNPYDNYLYICNMTSPYYSDDIVNEIVAGEWVVIGHIHANKVVLDNTTASFTTELANNIAENNAKVGITPQQANNIIANTSHRNTTNGNPHNILKSDLGLGNVNNTSDVDKPVSTAQQVEFDKKINIIDIIDNLLSMDTNKPLSANQGYVLKNLINNLSGSLLLQCSWDANTNTPDISETTNTGYFWIVSADGGTNLGGITDWKVNDWVVKTADGWAKIDNTDKVLSVNSQIGNINLTQDDIGDGSIYVRTHNDFTDIYKNNIETNNAKIGITPEQANDIASSIHTDKSNEISTVAEKLSLADDDLFIIEDSVDGSKKKVRAVNIGGGGDVSYGDENLIPFCNDPSTSGFVYDALFFYDSGDHILNVPWLNLGASQISSNDDDIFLAKKNNSIFLGSNFSNILNPDTVGEKNVLILSAINPTHSFTGLNNILIGSGAGYNTKTGSNNIFIGEDAGAWNDYGTNNIVMGTVAAHDMTHGSGNLILGTSAGYLRISGDNNVLLGRMAGYGNKTGSSNVFIGNYAGRNELGSNKLYIDNNETTTPLIYGEFDNDKLIFNCAVNKAQLKEQPTGDVDLAIATTKYVDDNAGVSYWTKSGANLLYTTGGVGVGIFPETIFHIAGANAIMTLESTNVYSSVPYVEISSKLKYNSNGDKTTFGKIRFKKAFSTDGDTSGITEFFSKDDKKQSELAMTISHRGNLEMAYGKMLKGIHVSAGGGIGMTNGITFSDVYSNIHTVTIEDGLILDWQVTDP